MGSFRKQVRGKKNQGHYRELERKRLKQRKKAINYRGGEISIIIQSSCARIGSRKGDVWR